MPDSSFDSAELGSARWLLLDPISKAPMRLCISQGYTVYARALLTLDSTGPTVNTRFLDANNDAVVRAGLNQAWADALAQWSDHHNDIIAGYTAVVRALQTPSNQWTQDDLKEMTRLLIFLAFYWRPEVTNEISFGQIQLFRDMVPLPYGRIAPFVSVSQYYDPVCFSPTTRLRPVGQEPNGAMPTSLGEMPTPPPTEPLPLPQQELPDTIDPNNTPVLGNVPANLLPARPQAAMTPSSTASQVAVAAAIGAVLLFALRGKV